MPLLAKKCRVSVKCHHELKSCEISFTFFYYWLKYRLIHKSRIMGGGLLSPKLLGAGGFSGMLEERNVFFVSDFLCRHISHLKITPNDPPPSHSDLEIFPNYAGLVNKFVYSSWGSKCLSQYEESFQMHYVFKRFWNMKDIAVQKLASPVNL